MNVWIFVCLRVDCDCGVGIVCECRYTVAVNPFDEEGGESYYRRARREAYNNGKNARGRRRVWATWLYLFGKTIIRALYSVTCFNFTTPIIPLFFRHPAPLATPNKVPTRNMKSNDCLVHSRKGLRQLRSHGWPRTLRGFSRVVRYGTGLWDLDNRE